MNWAQGGMYSNSNADSEKWVARRWPGRVGVFYQEANFTEGSLKLKIQTTKQAKKPPKNLENYMPTWDQDHHQQSDQKVSVLGKIAKPQRRKEATQKKVKRILFGQVFWFALPFYPSTVKEATCLFINYSFLWWNTCGLQKMSSLCH